MKITIIVDNQVYRSGLTPQHGCSLWITTEYGSILLDTGQDDLLVRHAELLGVPLEFDRLVGVDSCTL